MYTRSLWLGSLALLLGVSGCETAISPEPDSGGRGGGGPQDSGGVGGVLDASGRDTATQDPGEASRGSGGAETTVPPDVAASGGNPLGSGGADGAGGAVASQAGAGGLTSGSGGAGTPPMADSGRGGVQAGGLDASSAGDGSDGDAQAFLLSDCALPIPGPGGVVRPAGAPDNLRVLDWAGFKAAASYTFDDANASQIAHYAELQRLGVRMTFYLQTNKGAAADNAWAQAVRDGHELGNHTQDHVQTGTDAEVDAATAFILQHFGVNVWTMAAPYGDPSYVELARARFLANRGVYSGSVAANDGSDPYQLPCYIPPQGALADTFNWVLDSARSAGKWQIVLVHAFASDGYQPVDIGEFTASVTHTKSWGDVWIDSLVEVAAYWRAQKMFSSLVPVVGTGTERTWTWTLPDHFPPGKCLRVTIDGGTLRQKGRPLTWNDHGFYEVSLDQQSLTLSQSDAGDDTATDAGAGADADAGADAHAGEDACADADAGGAGADAGVRADGADPGQAGAGGNDVGAGGADS